MTVAVLGRHVNGSQCCDYNYCMSPGIGLVSKSWYCGMVRWVRVLVYRLDVSWHFGVLRCVLVTYLGRWNWLSACWYVFIRVWRCRTPSIFADEAVCIPTHTCEVHAASQHLYTLGCIAQALGDLKRCPTCTPPPTSAWNVYYSLLPCTDLVSCLLIIIKPCG